jgi:hypothetical protein
VSVFIFSHWIAFDRSYHDAWMLQMKNLLNRGHLILRNANVHENSVFYYLNLLTLLTNATKLKPFETSTIARYDDLNNRGGSFMLFTAYCYFLFYSGFENFLIVCSNNENSYDLTS